MSEFDALSPEAQASKEASEAAAIISEAESVIGSGMLEEMRKEAIERGRSYGVQEADRRSDTGQEREQRILWAMAYAAWEFDGKPTENDERYRKEFGLSAPAVTDQADRAPFVLGRTEKAKKS